MTLSFDLVPTEQFLKAHRLLKCALKLVLYGNSRAKFLYVNSLKPKKYGYICSWNFSWNLWKCHPFFNLNCLKPRNKSLKTGWNHVHSLIVRFLQSNAISRVFLSTVRDSAIPITNIALIKICKNVSHIIGRNVTMFLNVHCVSLVSPRSIIFKTHVVFAYPGVLRHHPGVFIHSRWIH